MGTEKAYRIWVTWDKCFLQPGLIQLDLVCTDDAIKPRPGQFFLLKPRRGGHFLGRPISAARWQTEPETLTIRFLIALKGAGTRELSMLLPGDEVYLTGPLGNGWLDMPMPRGDLPLALVAGGVGIAPLLALSQELEAESYDCYAGFRSEPFGLEGMKARNLTVATEDGSSGRRGLIPQFFDPRAYRGVYACGPVPMLKVIAQSCAEADVPCFISLERPMACGVGACQGCAVTTRDGLKRCCTEGPIFSAEEVIFE